jgi:patatin-like phospholipase/acyl hydrolase
MSEAGLGRPIQVLALSGGGYRGLFTASILEELEKISRAPLRERFDLIIGTSIGGIIACGLATGIPMAEILRAMLDRGPGIFDRRMTFFGRRIPVQIPRFGLIGSRYTAEGLKLAVNAVRHRITGETDPLARQPLCHSLVPVAP